MSKGNAKEVLNNKLEIRALEDEYNCRLDVVSNTVFLYGGTFNRRKFKSALSKKFPQINVDIEKMF